MNGSRWCAYFGFRVFWIYFIRGRINCKILIFRQISRKFTAHYGQNCGFWTNLGSFPKLVRFNKQYKNALLIYMAVFICFQALGLYSQLFYQPYIYCIIRHCHWYILTKLVRSTRSKKINRGKTLKHARPLINLFRRKGDNIMPPKRDGLIKIKN